MYLRVRAILVSHIFAIDFVIGNATAGIRMSVRQTWIIEWSDSWLVDGVKIAVFFFRIEGAEKIGSKNQPKLTPAADDLCVFFSVPKI